VRMVDLFVGMSHNIEDKNLFLYESKHSVKKILNKYWKMFLMVNVYIRYTDGRYNSSAQMEKKKTKGIWTSVGKNNYTC
jgi:hypothetical protein